MRTAPTQTNATLAAASWLVVLILVDSMHTAKEVDTKQNAAVLLDTQEMPIRFAFRVSHQSKH